MSVPSEDSRIQRVEDKVDSLSDSLRQHVIDETGTFKEMHVAIERLATTSELQRETMSRMANTLDGLATQNSRIAVVEMHIDRHTGQLDNLETVVEDSKDEISALKQEKSTIIKTVSAIAGVISTIVAAAWAFITWHSK